MAWKIYTSSGDRVPGEFKTRADAELFWRRNSSSFTQPGDRHDKTIYVDTGKGRGK